MFDFISCYLCKAKPTEMNNIDKVRERVVNELAYQFGLSTLHARIRFFEYFLHVAYRLEIKKWQARGEDKEKVAELKKKIQKRFKIELGLNIDKPRAGGAGTSNDGNVARKFFENLDKVVDITNLDRTALERCATILQVMASGCKIDVIAFDKYCIETARLLVSLYPWYYLPASIHKVLIHGSAVIDYFHVPIGQLSEEAQEARNKDWKRYIFFSCVSVNYIFVFNFRYREFNTRKASRSATNHDLINWLLASSDPLVTVTRGWPKKHEKPLSDDARLLLDDDADIPLNG